MHQFRLNIFTSQLCAALCSLAGAVAVFGQAPAGTAHPAADINPGSGGSYPGNFTVLNGALFFTAENPALGRELWRYDGGAAALAADVNPTTTTTLEGVTLGNSSSPNWLTDFNGTLYFSAFEPRHGAELWKLEGNSATRVSDISPDMNDQIKTSPNNSWPSNLTVFNNALYFSANGGTARLNYELWKFDGTGVSLVANIHPDSGTNYSSYPRDLKVLGSNLIFAADDGINGTELWKSDGTVASLLTNINPGDAASSSYPQHFTVFGDSLYFQALNSSCGYELWRTDGNNTTLVQDINPGAESSYPDFLTVFDGTLYFRATDGEHGYELWKADGSSTSMAADINLSGDSFPKNLTVFESSLVFAADDGVHGWELWKFDGTRAELITDLNPSGDSFPDQMTLVDGALYFTATTPETGYELWRYDGTNVILAADVNAGPGDAYPQMLTALDSEIVFRATADGLDDWELWSLPETPTASASAEISSILVSGGEVRLAWKSTQPATYFVEAASSVTGPFEAVSGPIQVTNTGEYSETMVQAGGAARFFRVMQR